MRYKRFVGLMLSVCMVAGLLYPTGQVSAGETSNTETETVETTEYPSYTLNGKKYDVYYGDDFSDSTDYATALGNTESAEYTWSDGVLTIPSSTKVSLFEGIQGAAELDNYTIAADFTYGDAAKHNAVIAYSSLQTGNTNKTTGYEFGIVKGKFRLYRNGVSGTTATLAGDETGDEVTTVFAEEGYEHGDKIRLSLTVTTDADKNVTLTAKATYNNIEKILWENVKDTSEYKITAGAPGLRGTDTEGTVDNLTVTSLGEVVDANCLYEDDLTSEAGYIEAVQSSASGDLTYNDGNILLNESKTYGTTLKGINNASTLQNYTVSADVALNYTSGYAGVMAYGSGTGNSTTGYEFAILNGNQFRIYRRGTNSTFSKTVNAEDLTGFENWSCTEKARLSLTVITNGWDATTETATSVRLIGTVQWNDKVVEVLDILDDSNEMITCGAPGLKSAPNKSAVAAEKYPVVDNIRVTTVDNQNIPYYENFEDSSGTVEALYGSNLVVESEAIEGTGYNRYGTLANKTSYLANASTWTGYAVEADVTMVKDTTATKAQYVGLIAGYIADIDAGYEFDIYENYGSTTEPYMARLLNKNTSKTIRSVRFDFTPGEVVTLRMEVLGTQIKCYANDELLIDAPIALPETQTQTQITGSIGLRALVCSANFDNISVVPCEAQEETSTATLPFVEDFDGCRADLTSLWNNGRIVKLEEDSNGNKQAVLATCFDTYNTYDTSISSLYLTGVDEAATWTDYVYEADVTLTDKEIITASGNAPAEGKIAAIVGAVNSENEGFEFGLCYNASWDDNYKVRLYGRADREPNTSQSYNFSLNEPVRLKMVISGNTIKCYANDELVIDYVAEDTATEFAGTVGIVTAGNAAKFDNIIVSSAADYYNLEKYRSDADNYTHPYKCGHVFGGWYTDADLTMPLETNDDATHAYAKWVDEEVLSVKAQLPAGTVVDENGRTMMRIVTTVDCDDYIETGFDVSTVNQSKTYTDTRVFSSIKSRYDSITVDYTPSGEFHETSQFFSTIILTNLKATDEHLTKEFTIKPFWITPDGTKVYGVTRVLTIQEGIDAINKSVNPYSL